MLVAMKASKFHLEQRTPPRGDTGTGIATRQRSRQEILEATSSS